ncbi:glutathione S-transferase N-terminal domain-containing protein [Novosphingobium sp. THN1]|uniref:glutathione S-transferase N-terminal domain-containing protein n=1 Tax=Novosphingobium sp. THN1 TaxID=1016987 RepID=UPI001967ADBE|nr:glutathione S-transferase N-terminal domain-containing protein [Novosphingobium sp. THN1]
MTLRLHNFFRSSTSTRLRVALNLKGLEYDYVAYVLRKNQHRSPEYLALNPAGLVPALELEDGTVLTQSLAIIEWLDETYPDPPCSRPTRSGGRGSGHWPIWWLSRSTRSTTCAF